MPYRHKLRHVPIRGPLASEITKVDMATLRVVLRAKWKERVENASVWCRR